MYCDVLLVFRREVQVLHGGHGDELGLDRLHCLDVVAVEPGRLADVAVLPGPEHRQRSLTSRQSRKWPSQYWTRKSSRVGNARLTLGRRPHLRMPGGRDNVCGNGSLQLLYPFRTIVDGK